MINQRSFATLKMFCRSVEASDENFWQTVFNIPSQFIRWPAYHIHCSILALIVRRHSLFSLSIHIFPFHFWFLSQFEPHLMAWSPDIATRLCLADPAHPTADIQLWDLRYPKHMLALLGRWPPPPSLDLHSTSSGLGNAGNVNALAWSPPAQFVKSRPALTLHDSDLIAVFLTASGALSTSSGACGSGLEPTSADFLVVWSVNEALKCVQAESASGHPSSKPTVNICTLWPLFAYDAHIIASGKALPLCAIEPYLLVKMVDHLFLNAANCTLWLVLLLYIEISCHNNLRKLLA